MISFFQLVGLSYLLKVVTHRFQKMTATCGLSMADQNLVPRFAHHTAYATFTPGLIVIVFMPRVSEFIVIKSQKDCNPNRTFFHFTLSHISS